MSGKRNGNWLSELPSVIKRYNDTIHNSTKMAPIQASQNLNEKKVYANLQDRKDRQKPKFKLGLLVRTADNKRVSSKGDSTNWSFEFSTVSEKIHDTIHSYRIIFLPES